MPSNTHTQNNSSSPVSQIQAQGRSTRNDWAGTRKGNGRGHLLHSVSLLASFWCHKPRDHRRLQPAGWRAASRARYHIMTVPALQTHSEPPPGIAAPAKQKQQLLVWKVGGKDGKHLWKCFYKLYFYSCLHHLQTFWGDRNHDDDVWEGKEAASALWSDPSLGRAHGPAELLSTYRLENIKYRHWESRTHVLSPEHCSKVAAASGDRALAFQMIHMNPHFKSPVQGGAKELKLSRSWRISWQRV